MRRSGIRESAIIDLVVSRHIVAHHSDGAKCRSAGHRRQSDVHHVVTEAPTVGPTRWDCHTVAIEDRITTDEAEPVKRGVAFNRGRSGGGIHPNDIGDKYGHEILAVGGDEASAEEKKDETNKTRDRPTRFQAPREAKKKTTTPNNKTKSKPNTSSKRKPSEERKTGPRTKVYIPETGPTSKVRIPETGLSQRMDDASDDPREDTHRGHNHTRGDNADGEHTLIDITSGQDDEPNEKPKKMAGTTDLSSSQEPTPCL